MKPIFLLFAVGMLTACGAGAKQNVDFEDFNTERPMVNMITHKSIQLDSSIKYTDRITTLDADDYPEHATGTTSREEMNAVNVDYSEEESVQIEDVTRKAEGIQQEVSGVWAETFTPMYNQFLWHGLDSDTLAANLEAMHESYGELEMQVDSLKTPAFLAPEHEVVLEQVKADLYLAISNRTLALIEFKLMNQNEDYAMNEAMLDIHLQNSSKYLSSASQSLSQLENLEASAGKNGDELIVADE
ncbi:hypothetical protein [Salinicoccus bachuensis]|uniref:DUF4142 domain-containing protein n=1 Tax=Salinicoccus bachuensis TaxID=3136731 RepID=A0ABZ3CK37_9STAP